VGCWWARGRVCFWAGSPWMHPTVRCHIPVCASTLPCVAPVRAAGLVSRCLLSSLPAFPPAAPNGCRRGCWRHGLAGACRAVVLFYFLGVCLHMGIIGSLHCVAAPGFTAVVCGRQAQVMVPLRWVVTTCLEGFVSHSPAAVPQGTRVALPGSVAAASSGFSRLVACRYGQCGNWPLGALPSRELAHVVLSLLCLAPPPPFRLMSTVPSGSPGAKSLLQRYLQLLEEHPLKAKVLTRC
jgi:hypothetical protein